MTLLPCIEIVWPVPAAVQVRPGKVRRSRAAIQRARNLAGSAPAGACARAGLQVVVTPPAGSPPANTRLMDAVLEVPAGYRLGS